MKTYTPFMLSSTLHRHTLFGDQELETPIGRYRQDMVGSLCECEDRVVALKNVKLLHLCRTKAELILQFTG